MVDAPEPPCTWHSGPRAGPQFCSCAMLAEGSGVAEVTAAAIVSVACLVLREKVPKEEGRAKPTEDVNSLGRVRHSELGEKTKQRHKEAGFN